MEGGAVQSTVGDVEGSGPHEREGPKVGGGDSHSGISDLRVKFWGSFLIGDVNLLF